MDTLERMQLGPLDESPNEGSSQSTIAIPLRYINMKMRRITCDEKATAVFFNVPAEPHLSKRLLFSLTAKITRGARLKKMSSMSPRQRAKSAISSALWCFHHRPRPPTDRSRWRRPSASASYNLVMHLVPGQPPHPSQHGTMVNVVPPG